MKSDKTQKSKHVYSSYALFMFVFILFVGGVGALTNAELDQFCNVSDSFLFRNSNVWGCGAFDLSGLNITHTNMTIIATNDTLQTITDRGATTSNTIILNNQLGIGGIPDSGLDFHIQSPTSRFLLENTATGGEWVRTSTGISGGSIKFSNTGSFGIQGVTSKTDSSLASAFHMEGLSGDIHINGNNPQYKFDINGDANVEDYLRIGYGNENALVLTDNGGDDSIFFTVNDGYGNFNIMLGADGEGDYTVTGDGSSKVLFTGHSEDGELSLNVAPKGTDGLDVDYTLGVGVCETTGTLEIGAPSNTQSGYRCGDGETIALTDGTLTSEYFKGEDGEIKVAPTDGSQADRITSPTSTLPNVITDSGSATTKVGLWVAESITSGTSSSQAYGLNAFAYLENSATYSSPSIFFNTVGGRYASRLRDSSNAHSIAGTSAYVDHAGTGTVTNGIAFLQERNDVDSGNTITNSYGLKLHDGTGGGTITNQYGVHIEQLDYGTNNFALYTAGNTKSYLGGDVGIGKTNPSVALDVDGQIQAVSNTFPVLGFTRETTFTGGALTGTTGIASAMELKTTTSGNMVEGFGGGIVFTMNDNTKTGNNYISRIYARRGSSDTSGHLQIWTGAVGNTNVNHFDENGYYGRGTTEPQYPIDVRGNSGGISAYFENNISVEDVIYHSDVNTENNVLESFNNDYLFANGSIDHSKDEYAAVTLTRTETDYSRPEITFENITLNRTIYVDKLITYNKTDETGLIEERNYIDSIPMIEYYNVTVNTTIYPYNITIVDKGWSASKRDAKYEKAFAELNENLNLYDNLTQIKSEVISERYWTATTKDKRSKAEKTAEKNNLIDLAITMDDLRTADGKLNYTILPSLSRNGVELLPVDASYDVGAMADWLYEQYLLDQAKEKICLNDNKKFDEYRACLLA